MNFKIENLESLFNKIYFSKSINESDKNFVQENQKLFFSYLLQYLNQISVMPKIINQNMLNNYIIVPFGVIELILDNKTLGNLIIWKHIDILEKKNVKYVIVKRNLIKEEQFKVSRVFTSQETKLETLNYLHYVRQKLNLENIADYGLNLRLILEDKDVGDGIFEYYIIALIPKSVIQTEKFLPYGEPILTNKIIEDFEHSIKNTFGKLEIKNNNVVKLEYKPYIEPNFDALEEGKTSDFVKNENKKEDNYSIDTIIADAMSSILRKNKDIIKKSYNFPDKIVAATGEKLKEIFFVLYGDNVNLYNQLVSAVFNDVYNKYFNNTTITKNIEIEKGIAAAIIFEFFGLFKNYLINIEEFIKKVNIISEHYYDTILYDLYPKQICNVMINGINDGKNWCFKLNQHEPKYVRIANFAANSENGFKNLTLYDSSYELIVVDYIIRNLKVDEKLLLKFIEEVGTFTEETINGEIKLVPKTGTFKKEITNNPFTDPIENFQIGTTEKTEKPDKFYFLDKIGQHIVSNILSDSRSYFFPIDTFGGLSGLTVAQKFKIVSTNNPANVALMELTNNITLLLYIIKLALEGVYFKYVPFNSPVNRNMLAKLEFKNGLTRHWPRFTKTSPEKLSTATENINIFSISSQLAKTKFEIEVL